MSEIISADERYGFLIEGLQLTHDEDSSSGEGKWCAICKRQIPPDGEHDSDAHAQNAADKERAKFETKKAITQHGLSHQMVDGGMLSPNTHLVIHHHEPEADQMTREEAAKAHERRHSAKEAIWDPTEMGPARKTFDPQPFLDTLSEELSSAGYSRVSSNEWKNVFGERIEIIPESGDFIINQREPDGSIKTSERFDNPEDFKNSQFLQRMYVERSMGFAASKTDDEGPPLPNAGSFGTGHYRALDSAGGTMVEGPPGHVIDHLREAEPYKIQRQREDGSWRKVNDVTDLYEGYNEGWAEPKEGKLAEVEPCGELAVFKIGTGDGSIEGMELCEQHVKVFMSENPGSRIEGPATEWDLCQSQVIVESHLAHPGHEGWSGPSQGVELPEPQKVPYHGFPGQKYTCPFCKGTKNEDLDHKDYDSLASHLNYAHGYFAHLAYDEPIEEPEPDDEGDDSLLCPRCNKADLEQNGGQMVCPRCGYSGDAPQVDPADHRNIAELWQSRTVTAEKIREGAITVEDIEKTAGEPHWHVVAAGGPNPGIESDHEAWHETRKPCLLCDRVAPNDGGKLQCRMYSKEPGSPCYGLTSESSAKTAASSRDTGLHETERSAEFRDHLRSRHGFNPDRLDRYQIADQHREDHAHGGPYSTDHDITDVSPKQSSKTAAYWGCPMCDYESSDSRELSEGVMENDACPGCGFKLEPYERQKLQDQMTRDLGGKVNENSRFRVPPPPDKFTNGSKTATNWTLGDAVPIEGGFEVVTSDEAEETIPFFDAEAYDGWVEETVSASVPEERETDKLDLRESTPELFTAALEAPEPELPGPLFIP